MAPAPEFHLTPDGEFATFPGGVVSVAGIDATRFPPVASANFFELVDSTHVFGATFHEGPAARPWRDVLMIFKRRLIVYGSVLAVLIPVLGAKAFRQNQQPRPPQPVFGTYQEYLDAWHKSDYHSQITEAKGLAEPFKGITTNGTIMPGLFRIKSTGVSTAPVRMAAEAYLASLTPDQRKRTLFPVNDEEWRKWENIDDYYRQGVGFFEMNDKQKEAGINLLRASLSAKGLKLSQDIMKLNYRLGELSNNTARLSDDHYFITVMGTPSAKEPWGWQIDGHHLVVNYFVLGDQVVMSPDFFGAEPVIATGGKYQGTSVLQDEQNDGLAIIRALNDDQKKRAIIKVGTKTKNQNVGEAFKDNVVLDYAGIPVSALASAQKKQVVDLVAEYVDNMDDGHAKVKMAEVKQHLDQTYFAWIGDTEPGSVFYYRIHSPVILIEFDHQQPIGLRGAEFDRSKPTLLHIHTVLRTPNGNDYGKDLLRLHYLENPGTHAE
jgi:Protein of unknown function (DUF3500)